MYMVLCPQELHRYSLHFTSLISRHFTPHHYTSHHFTYLHSTPTPIPLLVTTSTFVTLFLNLFSLQGKDASKPAGNWWSYKQQVMTKCQLPRNRPHGITTPKIFTTMRISYLIIYLFSKPRLFTDGSLLFCHWVSETTKDINVLKYRGADKFLAWPGRKQATATEDSEFHISCL